MRIEDIVDQIWHDMERLGWKGMRWKKEFYLSKFAELKNSTNVIFEDSFFQPIAKKQEPIISFKCGECGENFSNRDNLYSHYASIHSSNKPL